MQKRVDQYEIYSFEYEPTHEEWFYQQDLAELVLRTATCIDFELTNNEKGRRITQHALPALQRVVQKAAVPGTIATAYPQQDAHVNIGSYLPFWDALGTEEKEPVREASHLLMRFSLFAAELKHYDTLTHEQKRNLQYFCQELYDTLQAQRETFPARRLVIQS